MFPVRRFAGLAGCSFLFAISAIAQTTNGSINGTVLDPSGSAVNNAKIEVTGQETGVRRSATSSANGTYIIPQLPPGHYDIQVTAPGFATESRKSMQLLVNQSATVDFKMSLSEVSQTVEVTGAPPPLNTTSATLGGVVQHQQIVDLPLNGRSFTQLTLLEPGAVPQESGQQGAFTVKQGQGGISPSVNGQRGQQNNFTMDGVLNNAVYTNTWAISPPPDALQEFNVQSHITDAEFAISSGANINIVSRSGTNEFHGALWEFLRNDKLDARSFFDVQKPPYKQNQYGVNFGGPVRLPFFNGKDNTWFNAYWEGFRSRQSGTRRSSVLTGPMREGDFSGLLGSQVGTDSLGRPMYQNEIYDPATSRTDPTNPANIIRDPFPNNTIPTNRLNPASLVMLQKYYPLPNLGVAQNVFPNLSFAASTNTDSDQTGIRIDHRFGDNDTVFGRYNRSNQTLTRPESLPTYTQSLFNYAQTVAVGYTHLFGAATILNIHYGWTNTNFGQFDEPSGLDLLKATNYIQLFHVQNDIPLGPNMGISNGFTGVGQFAIPLGPQQNHDGHVDLSIVRGNHTIGVGGMVYHIHSFDDGWGVSTTFRQNATSQGGLSNSTGSGAASFMMGLPDELGGFLGTTSADINSFWYAGYVQDQWQASKNLTITAGLRYDFVQPAHYANIVSGLDVITGNFLVSAPVPPLYPQANVRPSYFDPQYNGFQPRFGIAYRATSKTVIRSAFAVFDDHNNTLVQEAQDPRISWPNGVGVSVQGLNHGLPTTYFNNLPEYSSFFNPLQPFVDFGANPRNKIPYAMEYNFGIEQQLSGSLVLNVNYVGSVSRHLFVQPVANTALYPAPGPISARQPFPAYGGSFSFDEHVGNASYNAFQAKLQKSLSSGLNFLASYTWSKSLDIQSEGQSGSIETIYDLRRDWGPSDFNRTHLFTFSSVYALPFGKGKPHLATGNPFVRTVLGNWNVGGIVTDISGQPFRITCGCDAANVGGGSQRAQLVGDPTTGFTQNHFEWFNTNAFATPAPFTFGNVGRNNMSGPWYNNVDFSAFKDFLFGERFRLQFRSEFFNVFNHTNFSTPDGNVQSSTFGQINGTQPPREIQFALKLLF
ncbi:MAG TPA: carboxypeptidase regulatory-like domain-containing protein [Bryobacteraceae bacterium]|nr:carboxypeptidase regulatory-like domain-containing protein [Bryobacteraceae bacterium]